VSSPRPPLGGAFVAMLDALAGTVDGGLSWVTGRRRTRNAVTELASWILGAPRQQHDRSR
jgi:hypothetical protein